MFGLEDELVEEANKWKRRCIAIMDAVSAHEGVFFDEDWALSEDEKTETFVEFDKAMAKKEGRDPIETFNVGDNVEYISGAFGGADYPTGGRVVGLRPYSVHSKQVIVEWAYNPSRPDGAGRPNPRRVPVRQLVLVRKGK